MRRRQQIYHIKPFIISQYKSSKGLTEGKGRRRQKPNAVMAFISGVERDSFDARDYSAGAMYTAMGVTVGPSGYPKTLDLREYLPPVRSQKPRGTCVAFAGSAMKEYQERLDTGYEGYFSPEFIYFYRENKPGRGMNSRDLMEVLLKRGCCTEDTLPYVVVKDENATAEIPLAAEEEAAKYKISSYARIYTIDELKTALFQSGVCYVAFPVYDVRPEFWRKKTTESVLKGGHAVAIVGYNNEGFILRNSWGEDYGDNGYVIYPYEDFGQHWDIWTAIDAQGSPKPPPTGNNACCMIS